jgi:hypothetical protein
MYWPWRHRGVTQLGTDFSAKDDYMISKRNILVGDRVGGFFSAGWLCRPGTDYFVDYLIDIVGVPTRARKDHSSGENLIRQV